MWQQRKTIPPALITPETSGKVERLFLCVDTSALQPAQTQTLNSEDAPTAALAQPVPVPSSSSAALVAVDALANDFYKTQQKLPIINSTKSVSCLTSRDVSSKKKFKQKKFFSHRFLTSPSPHLGCCPSVFLQVCWQKDCYF